MIPFRDVPKRKLVEIWTELRNTWRKCVDNNHGVAAVEFATILPVIVLISVVTADIALGSYSKMRVQNAAQFGAQYAVAHGFNSSSIANAVLNNTSVANLSVMPSPYEVCGCALSTGIASMECDLPCPDGSSPGVYVNVTTQATYKTIIPYLILPDSYTFVGQAMVRMQ